MFDEDKYHLKFVVIRFKAMTNKLFCSHHSWWWKNCIIYAISSSYFHLVCFFGTQIFNQCFIWLTECILKVFWWIAWLHYSCEFLLCNFFKGSFSENMKSMSETFQEITGDWFRVFRLSFHTLVTCLMKINMLLKVSLLWISVS